MKEIKKLLCENHGSRYPAFVCQHLNTITKVGFWEPFDSDSNEIYSNEELNGWCDECNKVLIEEGKWNEKSETFANIKLVCDKCYFAMKELNG
jgi:hypothetical protein